VRGKELEMEVEMEVGQSSCSPVMPFFTFNEAQEFLLDNLLSAGQPKGKKPKELSKKKKKELRQHQT